MLFVKKIKTVSYSNNQAIRGNIMLNKKILRSSLSISFAFILSACATSDGLNAKIATLSNQIDALSHSISELKSQQQTLSKDAQSAKVAAKKANERIDNFVASYKK